jgi:MFS transporter, ACS family, tartrate transporter
MEDDMRQMEKNDERRPSLDIGEQTRRVVTIRVMLLLLVGGVFLNLDRIALGFAALQMNSQLGFTPAIFGFGAGIYFLSYIILEVPSNFALQKFGAPNWLGRIMITWGVACCLMAFVVGAKSFYTARFLLGAAEAGFTPGVLYLIGRWYAKQHRGRAVSIYLIATSIAGIVAGPLSGVVMKFTGFGLAGWQWLFILLGTCTVLLGATYPFFLARNIDTARWLPDAGRVWLTSQLSAEEALVRTDQTRHNFGPALKSLPVWIYTSCYFSISIGVYGLYYWLPQLLKSAFPTTTTLQIGFLSAMPWIAAGIGVLVVGRSLDRFGDRRWHLVFLGLTPGLALILSLLVANPIVGFVSLIVAVGCSFSYMTAFWPNPIQYLSGPAAIGGLALINALGVSAGFVGPYVVGLLKSYTGSFTSSLAFFAIFCVIAGMIPLLIPRMFPNARKTARDPVQQSNQKRVNHEAPAADGML